MTSVFVHEIRTERGARDVVEMIAPAICINVSELRLDVTFVARSILAFESSLTGLRVEENDVMGYTEANGGTIRLSAARLALPDNFVPVVPRSENSIHEHLQVMARRRITVEKNRRSR